MLTNWRLFIKLLLSIVIPLKKAASDEMHDYEYMNSMITLKSMEKINDDASTKKSNTQSTSTRLLLKAKEQHDNIVRSYDDLIR